MKHGESFELALFDCRGPNQKYAAGRIYHDDRTLSRRKDFTIQIETSLTLVFIFLGEARSAA